MFPGVLALVSVAHAFEDDGFVGAAVYLVFALIAAVYVFRPMRILWVPMFAAFVLFTIAILVSARDEGRDEWIGFLVVGGIAPAAVLWIARPREIAGTTGTPEQPNL